MGVEVFYDFTVGDARYPTLGLQQTIGYSDGVHTFPSNNVIPYLHFSQVAHLIDDYVDAPEDPEFTGNTTALQGGYGSDVVGGAGTMGALDIVFVTLTPIRGIPLKVKNLSFRLGLIDDVDVPLVYVFGGKDGGTGSLIRTISTTSSDLGWTTITVPDRYVSRIYVDALADTAGVAMKWIRFTLEGGSLPPRRIHPRDDGLAGSSSRRSTGMQSQQRSNRRVGGYL